MCWVCGVYKQLMICKDFMVFIDYGFFVSYCYCMFKFGRLLKELNIMKFGDLIKKNINNLKIF